MKAQLPALLLDYKIKQKNPKTKPQRKNHQHASLPPVFSLVWLSSGAIPTGWIFPFAKRSGHHKPVPCSHALHLVIGISLPPRNHRHFLCYGHLAARKEADTHKLSSCWPPSDHRWAGALIHSWLVPHQAWKCLAQSESSRPLFPNHSITFSPAAVCQTQC